MDTRQTKTTDSRLGFVLSFTTDKHTCVFPKFSNGWTVIFLHFHEKEAVHIMTVEKRET